MGRHRDILKRKYHCHVVSDQAADVVMEISTGKFQTKKNICTRYVLVVDVSGSMDQNLQDNSPETLLDRVKVFAKLVIHNVSEKDSLAIVTFASDIKVDVPLRKMDKKGKKHAVGEIDQICTRGATNLEMGLLEGLDVLKRNPSTDTRDIIIVFTDGVANEGELDPEKLMKKYREGQEDFAQVVPLSAFTIGEYHPYLLKELASHMGSESFYWLNKGREFEADMLLPILLREETNVTDVRIEIHCLEGTEFNENSISPTYLEDSTLTALTYFIHGMPDLTVKHIPMKLCLPKAKFDESLGKQILKVDGRYLDDAMKIHSFTDYVVLLSTIKRTNTVGTDVTGEVLLDESTYCIEHGNVLQSPNDIMDVLLVIAEEEYRTIGVKAFNNIANCLARNQDDLRTQHSNICQSAILDITKVKRSYHSLMGDKGPQVMKLQDNASKWTVNLNEARVLLDPSDLGKVYAMQSSLEKEMPTARGVFPDRQQQPYLNWQLKNKLRKVEKLSKKTKRGKQVFDTVSVFDGKTLILSETLRCEKVGWKREGIADIIVRCGGGVAYDISACPYERQPKWYVDKKYPDTFLISSKRDFRKSTYLIKQAQQVQVPILRKKFVFQSIKKKKFLDIEDFRLQVP